MRSWLNSRKPNRGARISWWLSKLWKDYEVEGRESLCPNSSVYNIVIRAWADLGQPEEAEKLLTELIEVEKAGIHLKAVPNSEAFGGLIRAWLAVAEKGNEHALGKAVEWLNVLVEREEVSGLSSSAAHYLGILGAARKSALHCPDVLDLAVEVFDKLRNSHHTVECLHYSRLLQVALCALSKRENNKMRKTFIQQLAEDCCKDGLVSGPFLRALADGPVYPDGWTIEESERAMDALFPDWPLPGSWTRNVKPDNFLPQPGDLRRSQFRLSLRVHDPTMDKSG